MADKTRRLNLQTHRDAPHNQFGYVGFLDYRPHVQREQGARTIVVYVSKAAAERAYEDVRKVRLIFDAE